MMQPVRGESFHPRYYMHIEEAYNEYIVHQYRSGSILFLMRHENHTNTYIWDGTRVLVTLRTDMAG
jgi:hypothetical protein